ncbi:hypothetical protein MAPG_03158 [Magnaporthiopsis poae ATCC 64411]|uniref:Uncharacterized protein n=1 Tax=Magnaporthiopsis poae (strain ATCC 64411 / 73-15) TaxID=644358 RepID=A0A0C4DT98_MAGP6|nr:hypothetical protein MAPG_03158 [Magnaporthiopsis poae ATCC 64411]
MALSSQRFLTMSLPSIPAPAVVSASVCMLLVVKPASARLEVCKRLALACILDPEHYLLPVANIRSVSSELDIKIRALLT